MAQITVNKGKHYANPERQTMSTECDDTYIKVDYWKIPGKAVVTAVLNGKPAWQRSMPYSGVADPLLNVNLVLMLDGYRRGVKPART